MTEVPTGWRVTPLGDALRIRYGKALPRAERSDAAPFPVLGSAGRMTGTAVPLVAEPAVIVGRKGNVGAVQLEMSGCWPIDTTYYATIPDAFHPTFLAHQLRSLDLARLDSSTATPSLRREDLEAVEIVLPPLEEQRRIVDILEDHLSRLDAAERGLDFAEMRLARMRDQVVRRALFPSPAVVATSAPRLDDVGVNDGEIPDLPHEWRWARLGHLADVVGGVTKDSSRQSDPAYVEVPYLRVANVQRGRLDLAMITTIRVPPAKATALRLLPGDVLLNEGGDRDKLGRGWVWEGQIDNCIHQNHVFRARLTDGRLRPRLLSWAANSFGGRWCELNGKQSVNLASISLSKIRLMPVPVPPVQEQADIERRIQEGLDACDRVAAAIKTARQQSQALRRSILSAAFKGRLSGAVRVVEEPEAVGV